MKDVFFVHSKDKSLGKPRFTVAAVIKDSQMQFGVSRCSKKEAFAKKLGRTISAGRALKHPALVLDLSVAEAGKIGTFFLENAKKLMTDNPINDDVIVR